MSVSWHRLPHGGLEPQVSSCGPGGAVSPGDPVPMLTLTSCMPRSKSLDAEPRDRHSRQLISPWRAPWHITRSVRSGSSHPTPALSSWNPRDCSRSRREPSRPHDRDSPTAAEPQGADPRSPRRQSGSLTSSGNAHMRMICTGEPAQRPITTRANIRRSARRTAGFRVTGGGSAAHSRRFMAPFRLVWVARLRRTEQADWLHGLRWPRSRRSCVLLVARHS